MELGHSVDAVPNFNRNGGYEERLRLLGSKLKKSREMLKWAKQQVHQMSLNYLNYHSY